MQSPSDYVDYFLLVELSSLRAFVETLASPWTIGLVYPATLATIVALETLGPRRRRQHTFRRELALDVFYTVFNFAILWALFGTALSELTASVFLDALHAATGIDDLVVVRLDATPTWVRYLALLLFPELTGYVGHWLLHRYDFLWRFHAVHHSARELDVWNANRIHVVEKFFYQFVFFVPTAMIGFGLAEILPVALFRSFVSTLTHANVEVPLGPLRYVINTPQFHLWHHARDLEGRRGANYGDALVVWDYVFGTAWTPDDRSTPELGFDGVESYPTDFAGQLREPFAASGGMRRPLVGLGSVALLAAGIARGATRESATSDDAPAHERLALRFAPGYAADVDATLRSEGPWNALDVLEESTLLDERAVGLLARHPPVASLARDLDVDARLRTRIALALLEGAAGVRERADTAQRARTLRNAKLAARLGPRVAPAQLALGLTYLDRAERDAAPIYAMKSVVALRRALKLDPGDERARAALALARSRARVRVPSR
ncbi:MAG: sterol desaturase family protein [Myxococcales bacterium]|nr:sterol desaturase family protein [Myxococcales bacterium]